VQVGTRKQRATARLVADPEERKTLMLRMREQSVRSGPPRPVRPILKALRLFDYEAEIQLAVAQGGDLPVLEIVPHG
jgi:hypothetical protein